MSALSYGTNILHLGTHIVTLGYRLFTLGYRAVGSNSIVVRPKKGKHQSIRIFDARYTIFHNTLYIAIAIYTILIHTYIY